MVALFLVFKGTSILFSIVAVPIYIPANNVGGFLSLHTLSSIYCLWFFLMIVIVLICNSLIISSFEHLFMCLLAICMSSLGKCLSRSSAYFSIVFFLLDCMSRLHILEIKPLSTSSFANIFSRSIGWLFSFLMVYFAVKTL